MSEIVILSVGGSLIAPNEIDLDFLKNLKELLLEQIKSGKRFALICGGGKIARNYRDAAMKFREISVVEGDWLGIYATRLNAQLVKTIFGGLTHTKVIENPTEKINFTEKIIVAAGWEPGCSTDYDAVLLAKNLGVKKLVNLSNIDYVYDKDPRKFKDAKPIKETSWKDFRKLLQRDWSPGLNSPFDPVAAKDAEQLKLEVVVMNGKNMKNLKDYLDGKAFVGTKISG
jgi:uridylate kinase